MGLFGSDDGGDEDTTGENEGEPGEPSEEESNDQSFREEVKRIQESRNEAQEDQPNTELGSSIDPHQKNTHSPEELVERSEGDIKLNHLKDTSGRVLPWLDKPVIEHLKQDEQPEYIFADQNTALEFEHPDGTSGEVGY